jgi:hypothetical protein
VNNQEARDVRRLDTQPSLFAKRHPGAVRALLASGPAMSRKCPSCGEPFTGRVTKQACSGRCRATLSRRRQSAARAVREGAVRALLEAALRVLDEAPRVAWRKDRGFDSAQTCNPDVGIGPDAPGQPPTHSSEGPR